MPGWSKRQIVMEAFGELALASYEFDLNPQELEAAVRRLDLQMATWVGIGLHLGYNFGLTPDDTDLDQDSGIPLYAVEATYLQLAIRIAGSKGKQVPPSTRTTAKNAYDAMLLQSAVTDNQEQQLRSGMPAGAGSRRAYRPFLTAPTTDPLSIDGSGSLDFLGN